MGGMVGGLWSWRVGVMRVLVERRWGVWRVRGVDGLRVRRGRVGVRE